MHSFRFVLHICSLSINGKRNGNRNTFDMHKYGESREGKKKKIRHGVVRNTEDIFKSWPITESIGECAILNVRSQNMRFSTKNANFLECVLLPTTQPNRTIFWFQSAQFGQNSCERHHAMRRWTPRKKKTAFSVEKTRRWLIFFSQWNHMVVYLKWHRIASFIGFFYSFAVQLEPHFFSLKQTLAESTTSRRMKIPKISNWFKAFKTSMILILWMMYG